MVYCWVQEPPAAAAKVVVMSSNDSEMIQPHRRRRNWTTTTTTDFRKLDKKYLALKILTTKGFSHITLTYRAQQTYLMFMGIIQVEMVF